MFSKQLNILRNSRFLKIKDFNRKSSANLFALSHLQYKRDITDNKNLSLLKKVSDIRHFTRNSVRFSLKMEYANLNKDVKMPMIGYGTWQVSKKYAFTYLLKIDIIDLPNKAEMNIF